MRILYLHQHFCPPDGAGNNRSYEFGKEWQALGHDVIILSGSGNFKDTLPFWTFSKKYNYSGLKVIRLNVPYSHYMSFKRRSFAFLHYLFFSFLFSFRLPKFDIVYASSTPLTVGLLGIWCKRKLGSRLLFETVDLWPDVPVEMGLINNKSIIQYLYRLEKWIYRESDRIVCLSEGMRDEIVQKGIDTERIIVAHNGSNTSIFHPVKDKLSMKITLGFQKTDFIVLYAGTIGLANKAEFIVEVAKILQEKGSQNVTLLMIGDGNRSSKLREVMSTSAVSNIKWLNTIKKAEVVRYFQASDIGVVLFAPFKILETNSANKFFDYLASGLPVLINYGGWQKEYLEGYSCGFSEPSAQAMAEKILQLASSSSDYSKMGKNARELAVRSFDRKAIAAALSRIFLSEAP